LFSMIQVLQQTFFIVKLFYIFPQVLRVSYVKNARKIETSHTSVTYMINN